MNHLVAQFHHWDPNALCELFLCCCLGVSLLLWIACEIRELLRARKWPRASKGEISFRSNPSLNAGGAYAAPVEPQHLRRASP